MIFSRANDNKKREIIELLKKANLPFEDVPSNLTKFYTAVENEKILGVIGIEHYEQYGLLRSMAVDPSYRNRHIAEKLLLMLEENETIAGIETIYLLTETAEQYFSKKGYEKLNREDVPVELFQSSEFSHVCPVSATVMKKSLVIKGSWSPVY